MIISYIGVIDIGLGLMKLVEEWRKFKEALAGDI